MIVSRRIRLLSLFAMALLTTLLIGRNTFANNGNIVDVIREDGRFTTLTSVMGRSELHIMLAQNGPFTFFAPTDAAFAALPAGVLDELLGNKGGARQVLLHHTLRGEWDSAEISQWQTARTALGKNIIVTAQNGNLFVDDAQIIIRDIQADNGIIHVVDAVLLPPDGPYSSDNITANPSQPSPAPQAPAPANPAPQPPAPANPAPQPSAPANGGNSILSTVVADGRFTKLVSAIRTAGLANMLDQNGPFTLFAPTDAAFAALPAGTVEGMSQGQLRQTLLYHIIQNPAFVESFQDLNDAGTALGKNIQISRQGDRVFINDAEIIVRDIETDNGVIHVIDAVLVPPTGEFQ